MGTFKLSTGTRNYLVATDDLVACWAGNVIRIYGSPTSQAAADALIPATADAAIGSATLLCTISNDAAGTAISLDGTPSSGVVTKTGSETWRGINAASGYPSFYRASAIADTGVLSTTEKRFQGSVGTVGKDIIIAAAYMTIGQEQRLDSYSIAQPAE